MLSNVVEVDGVIRGGVIVDGGGIPDANGIVDGDGMLDEELVIAVVAIDPKLIGMKVGECSVDAIVGLVGPA